ncbi:MAG: 3-phosphoserine/phosphohydroxythreonine transaminase [Deltaproteobacteria bacterium]|nr:3-phosphoserine/phosphohydroxythreonine transaminase [Deltaproteobacteria bacterium]
MSTNVANFNAGPAGLPRPALVQAAEELVDFESTGISIMEHSHRGKAYERVHNEAIELFRSLLGVPDSHEVLFLQGGASGMFALLPMNFLSDGGSADYVVTGTWSEKALEEASLIGTTKVAGNGANADGKFTRIPSQAELTLDPGAKYLHITSNNTIAGTQYRTFPKPPSANIPLVADMSSDILSKPIDVSKFGLIYAGAQKNLGPSGVTVVIASKDWIVQGSKRIPKIFRFATHAANNSLYHTPPTFGIYLMRNVLRWVRDQGGAAQMAKRNEDKAQALYAAIDGSHGFYTCPVEKDARSLMNVVFRLPSEDLEKNFAKEAEASGLIGLKGHRSVGGMRASIYNAVGRAEVDRLTSFMAEFQKQNS